MNAAAILLFALAGAAPIDFEAWSGSDPARSSRAFSEAMRQRYPQGGPLTDALADLEANGMRCGPFSAKAAPAEAPSHECLRTTAADANCDLEWAVELRARAGSLWAPARGSVARVCLPALPLGPRGRER